MKQVLIALLFPLFCSAQTNKKAEFPTGIQDSISSTPFSLKNGEVIYQKVFASNLDRKELNSRINTLLGTNKYFRFEMGNENEVVGRLSRYYIDTEKYGFTLFKTPAVVTSAINARVVIQVKDSRYRVTLSDITFREAKSATNPDPQDVMLESLITKKRKTQLDHGKSTMKLVQYLDRAFSDQFDLQKSNTSTEF